MLLQFVKTRDETTKYLKDENYLLLQVELLLKTRIKTERKKKTVKALPLQTWQKTCSNTHTNTLCWDYTTPRGQAQSRMKRLCSQTKKKSPFFLFSLSLYDWMNQIWISGSMGLGKQLPAGIWSLCTLSYHRLLGCIKKQCWTFIVSKGTNTEGWA